MDPTASDNTNNNDNKNNSNNETNNNTNTNNTDANLATIKTEAKDEISNIMHDKSIASSQSSKSYVFKLLPTLKLNNKSNNMDNNSSRANLQKTTIDNDQYNSKKSRSKREKFFQLSPIIKKGCLNNSSMLDASSTIDPSNLNNYRSGLDSRDSNSDKNLVNLSMRLQTPYHEQILAEDMKPKEMIGQNAISKFYNHYKKLDKVRDQNQFNANPDSVYTAFLNKSESLNLLPSKIGLIKYKGEETKLALNHYSIGDKYAEVLSEGLRSISLVSSLELANNRLSSKGADLILSNLTKNTQIIDLANNKIGYIGCEHIANLLTNRAAKIIELNLEGNLLGDSALKQLIEALSSNNSIKKLNLSKNYLSNNSADRLSKMIEYNAAIEEFYLKWNQINGAGGSCIIKGIMASNNKIKVLDLSWNAFGGQTSPFAQTFAEFISTNETLIHLDLSHNNFGKEESKIISEALDKNHTLYGMHYDGNYGYIDPRGFLRLINAPSEKVSVNYVTHQIRGVKANMEYKKHTITELGQYKECCWICEGWREINFSLVPSNSGLPSEEPIYLHLNHEGYRNIYLPQEDNFSQWRMCPPEKIQYFFTAQDRQIIAEDQETCPPKEQIIRFQIDNQQLKTRFDKINCITNKFCSSLFDPKTYETKCRVKPRTPERVYIAPEAKIERVPWTFPISIFRDYRVDNDDMIRKCFEIDYDCTRIPKFVKKAEELVVVKELLRGAYKYLKESYRYYASIGVVSDIWCIHQAEINEFCRQSGLKDANFLDEKELGLLSIKTYTKGADSPFAKNPRNPDRALVRYQFLEFILRVAEECIVSKGFFKTYPEAVKALLDDKILPHAKSFDFHKFRVEKYWNEGCDTVYKTYLPVVQSVYRRYSGMKTKPGQKKFMCLEELFKLVNEAQLLNDHLVDRDISVFFSVSMLTQVDELNSDRIYQMSFLEFLECLARVADVYAAANIGENEAEVPYEVRYARPLHCKLEGLIAILFFRSVENIIKETYMLPEKSIFEWSIQEQQKAAKSIGKKRTIVMVDPITRPNVSPTAD